MQAVTGAQAVRAAAPRSSGGGRRLASPVAEARSALWARLADLMRDSLATPPLSSVTPLERLSLETATHGTRQAHRVVSTAVLSAHGGPAPLRESSVVCRAGRSCRGSQGDPGLDTGVSPL